MVFSNLRELPNRFDYVEFDVNNFGNPAGIVKRTGGILRRIPETVGTGRFVHHWITVPTPFDLTANGAGCGVTSDLAFDAPELACFQVTVQTQSHATPMVLSNFPGAADTSLSDSVWQVGYPSEGDLLRAQWPVRLNENYPWNRIYGGLPSDAPSTEEAAAVYAASTPPRPIVPSSIVNASPDGTSEEALVSFYGGGVWTLRITEAAWGSAHYHWTERNGVDGAELPLGVEDSRKVADLDTSWAPCMSAEVPEDFSASWWARIEYGHHVEDDYGLAMAGLWRTPSGEPRWDGQGFGLYCSNDQGEHWSLVTGSPEHGGIQFQESHTSGSIAAGPYPVSASGTLLPADAPFANMSGPCWGSPAEHEDWSVDPDLVVNITDFAVDDTTGQVYVAALTGGINTVPSDGVVGCFDHEGGLYVLTPDKTVVDGVEEMFYVAEHRVGSPVEVPDPPTFGSIHPLPLFYINDLVSVDVLPDVCSDLGCHPWVVMATRAGYREKDMVGGPADLTSGVWLSRDGGEHFEDITDELGWQIRDIRFTTFAPRELSEPDVRIYVGTDGAGMFHKDISLTSFVEFEDCTDGGDNDGDGLNNCDDPDCIAADGCELLGEDCNDGIDNDGDGFFDCADMECVLAPWCSFEECEDCIDNDGDGYMNCDDEDCWQFPSCAMVGEDCFDGIDNDLDGEIDFDDAECSNPLTCKEDDCSNGWDDNADGLIDCDDPTCCEQQQLCGGSAVCTSLVEDCSDGWDNDYNNATDCEDAACVGHSDCIFEECEDCTDNDGDGLFNCDDDECWQFAGCAILGEDCFDGVDNDGDGDTDMDDAECLTLQNCGEVDCADGVDDDGNGLIDCADPFCEDKPFCQ